MTTVIAQFDSSLKWYVAFTVLSVAAIIGIWMVSRVIREAKGEVDDTIGTKDDLLAPLAHAYAAGQMSREEYQRILASMGRGAAEVERLTKKPAAIGADALTKARDDDGLSAPEPTPGPPPAPETEHSNPTTGPA